jgi:hypothetical protein
VDLFPVDKNIDDLDTVGTNLAQSIPPLLREPAHSSRSEPLPAMMELLRVYWAAFLHADYLPSTRLTPRDKSRCDGSPSGDALSLTEIASQGSEHGTLLRQATHAGSYLGRQDTMIEGRPGSWGTDLVDYYWGSLGCSSQESHGRLPSSGRIARIAIGRLEARFTARCLVIHALGRR